MDWILEAERIMSKRKTVLVDYEGEHICTIDGNTEFDVKQGHTDGEPTECRIFIGDTLIECYDQENDVTGLQLATNMVESIMEGVLAGATYLRVNPN